MSQQLGELAKQFLADVLHDASTELGHLAGDLEIRADIDPGLVVALVVHLGGDERGRIASTAGVASLAVDHGTVIGVVPLDELCGSSILGSDRTDLDLDRSGVDAIILVGQLRPRKARSNLGDVGQHRPRLIDGRVDGETVLDLHAKPSSIADPRLNAQYALGCTVA